MELDSQRNFHRQSTVIRREFTGRSWRRFHPSRDKRIKPWESSPLTVNSWKESDDRANLWATIHTVARSSGSFLSLFSSYLWLIQKETIRKTKWAKDNKEENKQDPCGEDWARIKIRKRTSGSISWILKGKLHPQTHIRPFFLGSVGSFLSFPYLSSQAHTIFLFSYFLLGCAPVERWKGNSLLRESTSGQTQFLNHRIKTAGCGRRRL